MATNTSVSALPDWSQLNFARNCSAYGQWLAAFIAPNPWNPQEALGGSVPLTLDLVSTALPPGWIFNESAGGGGQNWTQTIQSPAGTAYFSDIMQWFIYHVYHTYNATDGQWYADSAFVDNVIWAPADDCPREFCKAIAFTGNADLSGIGVVISYYIEASLTTLYLLVFTSWRIRRFLKKRKQRRLGGTDSEKGTVETASPPPSKLLRAVHRLFDALRGSLDTFLMAAIVLALAILVAAIVLEANHTNERRRHPVDAQNIPSGRALYDSALGLLVGLYAVFPVVVLYALLPHEDELLQYHYAYSKTLSEGHSQHPQHARGRRRWLRRAVLVVLWALAAALVFLDPRSELDYEYQGISTPEDNSDDNNFADVLYACDQRGGRVYWRMLYGLHYLVIGVPLLWLLLTGLVYASTGNPWRAKAGDKIKQAASENENEKAKSRNQSGGKENMEGKPSILRRVGRPVWRHAVAWVSCAIMWTILLCLTVLRQDIIEVADGLDTSNDWEVGQILAIATWGPVAVDFGFNLLFGIEAGLSSRLPLDLIVRYVVSTSNLQRSSTDSQPDGSHQDSSHAASVSGSTHASRVNSAVFRNTAPRDDDKSVVLSEKNRDPSTSPPLRLRAQTSASSSPENGQPAAQTSAPAGRGEV